MNLAEMAEQLPNGLHDAEVEAFLYDLKCHAVTFTLDIWIGTMNDPPSLRERYRRGILRFDDVQFFTKTESAYFSDDDMTLLDWELKEDFEEKAKLPESFSGLFFYLAACYCQFRIGCGDVSFEWITDAVTNRNPAEDDKV